MLRMAMEVFVVQLFKKVCPECGGRVTFMRFVRTTSRTFNCDKCGVQLETGNFWIQILSMVPGMILFISIPINQARHNQLWYWALIPGFILFMFWSFMFLSPRRVRSRQV